MMRCTTWLAVFVLWGMAGTANAADRPACSPGAPDGTVCACPLAALHPSQTALGLLRVQELQARGYDWLQKHVAREDGHTRIVVAADGGFYVIDGHHHARAMSGLQPGGQSVCTIVAHVPLSPADPAAFWAGMASRGYARLAGPDGVVRPGVFPPPTLAGLQDDRFRYLAGWLEYRCDVKLEGDFAEFRLADVLRQDPASSPAASMKDAEAEALRFVMAPAQREALAAIPGASNLQSCK